MRDEQKFSEEEFAVILRKAAQLQATPKAERGAEGLTLDEMKSIAAEAGFDPELVERAAGLVPREPELNPVERFLGGALKHRLEHTVPVLLTDERIGALTSAVQSATDQHGKFEANIAGLEWRSVGEPSQMYVTAWKGGDQTNLSVSVDRSAALLLTGLVNTGVGVLAGVLAYGLLEVETGIVTASCVAGGLVTGLATARAFWTATTRSFRNRLDRVMERMTQTLRDSE